MQKPDCRAANWRAPDESQSIPGKVLIPLIAARIEQWCDLARLGINPGQITPFVQIALSTGKREIVEFV